MPKLFGIQYLRGIATILVVIYHSPGRFGVDIHLGAAGVDLFFVVSGFIMVLITSEKSTIFQFALDRFLRIAPLYWTATFIVILAAAAGLFPNIIITYWHLISSLLFIPSYSPSNGQIWPILIPGWTLNVEIFFYIVFGSLLFLRNQIVQLFIITSIFITLVLSGYFFEPVSAIGRAYTNPIILEFIAGGWLGIAWKRYPRFPGIFGYPAIVIAVIWLGAAFFFGLIEPRLIVYGGPMFLLVLGVLTIEKNKRVARFRIPAALGDASYSIYLWHTLAIPVAFKVSMQLQIPTTLGIALCATAGILAGLLGYYFIEIPISKSLTQRRSPDLRGRHARTEPSLSGRGLT